MHRSVGPVAALALAAAAALGACSGAGEFASFEPLPIIGAPVGLEKISANGSTKDQIIAALKAAGVSEPERWATEVVEYRPYATDDPAMLELQRELNKYHPDTATLRGILSMLRP